MPTETFTTSTTWTCPQAVTFIKVECWGAGGAGSDTQGVSRGGGGGGGGNYCLKNALRVNPGTQYTITVGTSSAGNNGGDTSFGDGTSVLAKGGNKGVGGAGGGGGSLALSIGDIKNRGGTGGNTTSANNGGCGGGSSGGTDSSGANGLASVGSTGSSGGTAPTGGGNGGRGGDDPTNAGISAGTAPGGGGAGTCFSLTAGTAGANGQVVLTYNYSDGKSS